MACLLVKSTVSESYQYQGCSRFTVMHASFHASMLRPASQVGPMHESKRVEKLVNAALL